MESPSHLSAAEIEFIENLYGKNYSVVSFASENVIDDFHRCVTELEKAPEVILNENRIYIRLDPFPNFYPSNYFDIVLWCEKYCAMPYGVYGALNCPQGSTKLRISPASVSLITLPADTTALLLAWPSVVKIDRSETE